MNEVFDCSSFESFTMDRHALEYQSTFQSINTESAYTETWPALYKQ